MDNNPLHSSSPEDWERLLEALDPDALLVVIELRMSRSLRVRCEPADILGQALLHVWRDRHQFEWQGFAAFRSWVLQIIDHRIHDAADREGAQRRGGSMHQHRLDADSSTSSCLAGWPRALSRSTTPSRIASLRDQAAAIVAALAELPEDCREVVQLRLIEGRSTAETARALHLGESAVKHRLRRGAAIYRAALVMWDTNRLA